MQSDEPYEIIGADRPGPWLITCDHASNRVPADICGGDLGLATADMARHIAYDVGAAGVARALSRALDSPAVLSNFSRLVIDPNRGEDDPTLIMQLYDGTIIPGNRALAPAAREHRLASLHRPYHRAVAAVAARGPARAILSIHSFTPCLRGRAPRPWQVGVLYSRCGAQLSHALLAALARQAPDLCIGDNEPYVGHLPGDAIDRHALQPGRLNALIELRNDLIETPTGQQAWADRLAPILSDALASCTTTEAHHG